MNIIFLNRKTWCLQCEKQGLGVMVGTISYCRDCFQELREAVKLLGPHVGDERSGVEKGGPR